MALRGLKSRPDRQLDLYDVVPRLVFLYAMDCFPKAPLDAPADNFDNFFGGSPRLSATLVHVYFRRLELNDRRPRVLVADSDSAGGQLCAACSAEETRADFGCERNCVSDM